MREQSIVGNYYRLDPRKRMDVIIYHYECFPAIIRDYEMELEDWILTSRASARQESLGDLGVRVQSGSNSASPTEGYAIERMQVEQIVKSGELDRYSMALSDADEIRRGLMEVRLMRREYDRMKVRMRTIGKLDREFLLKYVSRENRAENLSEDLLITQKSIRNRIYNIKKRLFDGFVENFDFYSDDTILILQHIKEA